MPNNVEIIITAIDKASGTFGNIGKSLTSVGGTLTKSVTLPLAAAGAGILKLSSDAASLAGIQGAFEGLSSTFEGGSDAMLRALQDASGGLITNRDLMEKFNLAAGLVSKDFAQQLPDAFGYLGKVAAATGQDMGFLLDSLVRGVGRLSPLILDNLGIQLNLTDAYEAYAQQLGISAEELTKTQQQTAVMSVVMEKLAANTADMPEVVGSAAAQFGTLQTMLSNLKDEIGTELLPAVIPLLQQLGELAKQVLPQVVAGVSKVVSWFTSLSPEGQKLALIITAVVTAAGPLLIIVGSLISAFGAILPVIGAVIGVLSGPLLLVIGAIVAAIALLVTAWRRDWGGIQEKTAAAVAFLKNLWTGTLIPAINAISGAIQGVIGWVQRLIEKLKNIKLPDFLQGHSPSPLELTFTGTADALKELNQVQFPRLSANLQGVGVGGGGMGGGTRIVQHIYPSAGMDENALADKVVQRLGRVARNFSNSGAWSAG